MFGWILLAVAVIAVGSYIYYRLKATMPAVDGFEGWLKSVEGDVVGAPSATPQPAVYYGSASYALPVDVPPAPVDTGASTAVVSVAVAPAPVVTLPPSALVAKADTETKAERVAERLVKRAEKRAYKKRKPNNR